MARKLEAQFDGAYLMSSVLMTSTMKSEPGTPLIRDCSFGGVPVSAAATCMLGGSAEGRRAGAASGAIAGVAPFATGATVVAAPATATPARNLRRLTSGRGSFRLMDFSLDRQASAAPAGKCRLTRTCKLIK